MSLKLDAYLPYRLSVTANAVSELIARAYKTRFGLTIPQWRLIAVLGEDGPLTPAALGKRTVMDKVTIHRASAGLVERGLAARAPNARDGRSHRLALTAEGERLYAEVAPLALKYEEELLASFSAEDQAVAHDLLRRLETAAEALTMGA